MPSYQYTRDIKPQDLEPEKPPELSKKEKAQNWWHYNRVWVFAGIIVLIIAGVFISDIVRQVKPDFTIGIVSPHTLPDEAITHLQEQLTPYFEDTNGDGKVIVKIDQFTIMVPLVFEDTSEGLIPPDASGAEDMGDPTTQMAAVTRLVGALSTGDIMMFMTGPDDDATLGYQKAYGLFGYLDGTVPEDDATDIENMSIAWANLPALTALDMNVEGMAGETYNIGKFMSGFRIGVRPYEGTALEGKKGMAELWSHARDVLDKWQ